MLLLGSLRKEEVPVVLVSLDYSNRILSTCCCEWKAIEFSETRLLRHLEARKKNWEPGYKREKIEDPGITRNKATEEVLYCMVLIYCIFNIFFGFLGLYLLVNALLVNYCKLLIPFYCSDIIKYQKRFLSRKYFHLFACRSIRGNLSRKLNNKTIKIIIK